MLSYNVPTTFLAKESDFFYLPGRCGLDFNAHSMHSLIEDRVTSLNNLCTACECQLLKLTGFW